MSKLTSNIFIANLKLSDIYIIINMFETERILEID